MTRNTTERIVSALVMLILVAIFMLIGKHALSFLLLILGVIITDEFGVNFLRRNRLSIEYVLMQVSIVVLYIFFAYIEYNHILMQMFLNIALLFHCYLVHYLFSEKIHSTRVIELFKKIPYLSLMFVFPSIMLLLWIANQPIYISLFAILFVITWGMDTGGWFFGKKFGKHKLWPEVSPKKTYEGLIGGMITAGVLGSSLTWILSFNFKWYFVVVFMVLGGVAQLGDLVQSKLKRQFMIKDSSNLIPGHGGVYDRVDSLLFLVPFYIITIQFLDMI